ncbi:calcium/sodium antiporter [Candidatus Saccharibacteria bacterium]|nr:calcium/sodium antiporter [Candidatus Saccharibacteria bacterium]
MFLQIILLIVGFVILIKGADWMIDGASSAASHFKVSKLLIGLTIVAFGTSAPELAVSFASLLNNTSDVLLGNVIGSNILNILLLIGIGAVIRPIKIKKETISKELPLLLLITATFVVLFLGTIFSENHIFTRASAGITLLTFCVFMFYIITTAKKARKADKEVEKPKFKLGLSLLLTVIGLAGIIGGAELVVNSATTIAQAFGVSDRIIALTIIAFGTSLPELVTTITAAKKNETELLVGNIIGSNIFNICIVLGLPALIFGTVSPTMPTTSIETISQFLDLGIMALAAVLLFIFAKTGKKISRAEGVAMLIVFTAYYSFVIYGALV